MQTLKKFDIHLKNLEVTQENMKYPASTSSASDKWTYQPFLLILLEQLLFILIVLIYSQVFFGWMRT